jgi:hypothetical protein
MLASVLTSPPGSIVIEPTKVEAEKIDTAAGIVTLEPRPSSTTQKDRPMTNQAN